MVLSIMWLDFMFHDYFLSVVPLYRLLVAVLVFLHFHYQYVLFGLSMIGVPNVIMTENLYYNL